MALSPSILRVVGPMDTSCKLMRKHARKIEQLQQDMAQLRIRNGSLERKNAKLQCDLDDAVYDNVQRGMTHEAHMRQMADVQKLNRRLNAEVRDLKTKHDKLEEKKKILEDTTADLKLDIKRAKRLLYEQQQHHQQQDQQHQGRPAQQKRIAEKQEPAAQKQIAELEALRNERKMLWRASDVLRADLDESAVTLRCSNGNGGSARRPRYADFSESNLRT